jgi:hypothetical protein
MNGQAEEAGREATAKSLISGKSVDKNATL